MNYVKRMIQNLATSKKNGVQTRKNTTSIQIQAIFWNGVTAFIKWMVSPSQYNNKNNGKTMLVGGLNPSEKLGWLFPLYGKIKNVPNHQPEMFHIMFNQLLSYPWMTLKIRHWTTSWAELLLFSFLLFARLLLPQLLLPTFSGSIWIMGIFMILPSKTMGKSRL